MTVTMLKPQLVAAQGFDPEHLTILSRAMASWFVRLDNSYFDVDDLGHKRSRVDIEQTAMIRFREEFPDIPLNNALMSAVLKRAIHTRHTVAEETILPWNGRIICRPGDRQRVIVERGVATINAWREPGYRQLGVTDTNYGVVGEFFDWFFTRTPEREMFLNWLAWALQNEGDKPNWAEEFAALVGRLEDWAEDPTNIARLYNALIARVLPADFSAKTLNVDTHATDIMRQVFGNGRATVLDQLKEHLDATKQHAIPESEVVEMVTGTLKANINSTKHLMSDLGWRKCSVKWGGVDYARQLWVQPGYTVENGKIFGPDGFEEPLARHLGYEIEYI